MHKLLQLKFSEVCQMWLPRLPRFKNSNFSFDNLRNFQFLTLTQERETLIWFPAIGWWGGMGKGEEGENEHAGDSNNRETGNLPLDWSRKWRVGHVIVATSRDYFLSHDVTWSKPYTIGQSSVSTARPAVTRQATLNHHWKLRVGWSAWY